MDTILFVLAFVKNWKKIGSLVPSSVFLAKRMVKPIDFENAKIIIEAGAGTGSITKYLLKKMNEETRLIAFEVEERFCKRLRQIGDKRLTVVHDSATNIRKYLGDLKADYVVSGIPTANLPKEQLETFLYGIERILKNSGVYIQFQYAPRSYKKIKSIFYVMQVGFTPLNLPPAFVYECVKKNINY